MSFVRQQIEDEQGIALMVVIGVIALISVMAVGGFALASQSVHSTARLQTEEKSFQAASSGLDRVLATFSQANFQGQNSYQVSGTTPDGSYLVSVGRDPAVPYRFSIVCTGTAGTETARVRQDFYFLDLWSVNIGQGENPGSPPGTAGDFNGGPEIHGPFFVSGGNFNSNPDFFGGPLFASKDVSFGGGTGWYPEPAGTKYVIYAGGACSGQDASKVIVQHSCPDIELPWVAADYMASMLAKATSQSADNLRGDGNPAVANGEVATTGAVNTYTGTRYPGQLASQPYKVINGPLSITGSSASFGKVSGATNWDDFAFDTVNNTLYVEGIVYVKGDVTIGSGVANYKGSGIIVSEGDVNIDTGGTFQPVGGGSGANDLSAENSLAVIGTNVTLGRDSNFEGTVFCNQTFEIGKSSIFQGAVHANLITNPSPPKAELWMEEGMAAYKVPEGMPGTATDPRGSNFGGGVVIPGTWSRIQ